MPRFSSIFRPPHFPATFIEKVSRWAGAHHRKRGIARAAWLVALGALAVPLASLLIGLCNAILHTAVFLVHLGEARPEVQSFLGKATELFQELGMEFTALMLVFVAKASASRSEKPTQAFSLLMSLGTWLASLPFALRFPQTPISHLLQFALYALAAAAGTKWGTRQRHLSVRLLDATRRIRLADSPQAIVEAIADFDPSRPARIALFAANGPQLTTDSRLHALADSRGRPFEFPELDLSEMPSLVRGAKSRFFGNPFGVRGCRSRSSRWFLPQQFCCLLVRIPFGMRTSLAPLEQGSRRVSFAKSSARFSWFQLRNLWRDFLRAARSVQQVSSGEGAVPRLPPTTFWFALRNEDGPTGALMVAPQRKSQLGRDKLEVYQTLAEQAAATWRQQSLLQAAQDAARQRERRQVAYELHDHLTQDLVSALMYLEAARTEEEPRGARRQDPMPSRNPAESSLAEAERILRGALEHSRHLTWQYYEQRQSCPRSPETAAHHLEAPAADQKPAQANNGGVLEAPAADQRPAKANNSGVSDGGRFDASNLSWGRISESLRGDETRCDSESVSTELERYVEDFSRNNSLPASYEAVGTPLQLPSEAHELLLVALREALSNVKKHARATRIRVTLSQINGTTALDVCDDGLGTQSNKNLGHPWRGGFGLVTLRERIEALGGQLILESEPQGGTTLSVQLPPGGQQ